MQSAVAQEAPDTQPAGAGEPVSRRGAFPGEWRFLAALALLAGGVASFMAWRACPAPAWLTTYGLGFPLVAYSLALIRRYRVARRWPEVQVQVEGAFVEEVLVATEEHDGRNYRPLVHYRFDWDGRTVRCDRFAPDLPAWNRVSWDAARQLARAYPRGAVVTARVCPTDPAWAVLRTDRPASRLSHACAWLILGAGLMAFSLWLAHRCV